MRVSQVEVPRVTRPGTALGSSQKLTMLINTSKCQNSKFFLDCDLSDTAHQESGRNIVADEVVAKVPLHQKVKHQSAVVPV